MMHCAACCVDFDINPLYLIRPELLDRNGYEFVSMHWGAQLACIPEAEAIALIRAADVLPDGRVKIKHRCAWLNDEHRCVIYEDRPQICRDFDCSTKRECTNVAPLEFRR